MEIQLAAKGNHPIEPGEYARIPLIWHGGGKLKIHSSHHYTLANIPYSLVVPKGCRMRLTVANPQSRKMESGARSMQLPMIHDSSKYLGQGSYDVIPVAMFCAAPGAPCVFNDGDVIAYLEDDCSPTFKVRPIEAKKAA